MKRLGGIALLLIVELVLITALLVPGTAATAQIDIEDLGTELNPAEIEPGIRPYLPTGMAANTQNVELVGQIGGVTIAVAVNGNYAYIGEGPRLTILNITNPSAPVVVGKSSLLPDIIRGLAVAGSYAYVADGGGGLRIINVTNPAAPAEASFYDTPGYAYDVAVAGSYAYVADGGAACESSMSPTRPPRLR